MRIASILCVVLALAACSQESPPESATSAEPFIDSRVAEIHESTVFVDMHAHPSRFHRANVETILPEEIEVYRRSTMDIVVANISSDMAYDGRYTNRDGSEVERGRYKPAPGEVYALAADRLARLGKTIELGYAVHADSPSVLVDSREKGQVAVLPALEGAYGCSRSYLVNSIIRLHALGSGAAEPVSEIGKTQVFMGTRIPLFCGPKPAFRCGLFL